MHFLDDFYLLISVTRIVPVSSFCHIQSQHTDIVLLTPLVRAAPIFVLRIDSQLFLDELPISDLVSRTFRGNSQSPSEDSFSDRYARAGSFGRKSLGVR